jgi:excisionase family DNA binding protein
MTLTEVGKKLRVKRLTVKHWITKGKLKGIKINSRGDWRVTENDLEEYLKGKK